MKSRSLRPRSQAGVTEHSQSEVKQQQMKINDRTIAENLDASGLRLAIVSTRWNDHVSSRLLTGAVAAIETLGGTFRERDHFICPGAFEIPTTLKVIAETGRYSGAILLGSVIRGETPHFDYVAGPASFGISQISVEHRFPVGFGLLTVDSEEQALARSAEGRGNKGWEAVETVVEMCTLLESISTTQS